MRMRETSEHLRRRLTRWRPIGSKAHFSTCVSPAADAAERLVQKITKATRSKAMPRRTKIRPATRVGPYLEHVLVWLAVPPGLKQDARSLSPRRTSVTPPRHTSPVTDQSSASLLIATPHAVFTTRVLADQLQRGSGHLGQRLWSQDGRVYLPANTRRRMSLSCDCTLATSPLFIARA